MRKLGWIAVGGASQIIAVNPADPTQHAVLSDKGGLPLTWSDDGSELLILRRNDLVVLKADGTPVSFAFLEAKDFPLTGYAVIKGHEVEKREELYDLNAPHPKKTETESQAEAAQAFGRQDACRGDRMVA